MQPLISVVIPTYNRKELCKRAVQSVLHQSYHRYEVLVVDDASTDGTSAEHLYGSSVVDTRLRYIRQPYNGGVAKARNRGIRHARGEWIAFLDSDDCWYPDKLKKQVAWIDRNPDYTIVQTKEIWIRHGVRVNPPKTHEKIAGNIFTQSLQRCMITPSSVIIKADLLEKVGLFNESLPACEDYDLWLRITLHFPVGLVDEYLLVRYGGHNDQLSKSVQVLDKYRIRALMHCLVHEKMTNEQKYCICKTLAAKADIIASGAQKRHKKDEYERYRQIANTYRTRIR